MLFVFWIPRQTKQHSGGGEMEGWDHPAAAPFSLSHSHLIPSFPLLFILQLQSCAPLAHSLTLSHKVSLARSLSLFLYLSHRHKDGWRSSWNGAHNRLCHKVSSLSCIRLSAAFFSSCEPPYPTGVCVCEGGSERHSMATDAFVQPKVWKGPWVGGLAVSEHRVIFLSFFSHSASLSLCLPLPSCACHGGWARGNVRATAWWNT